MPIVQITTNLGRRLGTPFLKSVSSLVADMTNKPEKAVVVTLNSQYDMWYNGADAPLAHIRFSSLDMPVSDHVGYSAKFAELFSKDLDVDTERVIVEFNSPQATHLGKNGSTIAEIRKVAD